MRWKEEGGRRKEEGRRGGGKIGDKRRSRTGLMFDNQQSEGWMDGCIDGIMMGQ